MTYSAEPMEGQERVGRPCWYVVQVASGCEQKVKSTLEQRSRALDMTDRILQVAIPQAPVVRIRKDGSRQNTEENLSWLRVRADAGGAERQGPVGN